MALSPGTYLGPYEILASLGAGGMGVVYQARDTRLKRTVAIKVLPPELFADPKRRERLAVEARAISSLSHPHICVLYDVGQQDGVDYIVVECLEGETLADRVSRAGGLGAATAMRYGLFFFIRMELPGMHSSGTLVIPLTPGHLLPNLPPNGFESVEQVKAIPGAREIPERDVFPVRDPSTYGILRATTQRNLFRMRLPEH